MPEKPDPAQTVEIASEQEVKERNRLAISYDLHMDAEASLAEWEEIPLN